MNKTMKLKRHALLSLAALVAGSLAWPVQAGNQVDEIVVVFKTHYDIGYTDLVTNILTKYRTQFADKALAVIDQSESLPPDQRFTWTVPGWPLKEMLWTGQTPERRARLEQAVKENRLAVHAMPFSLETETLDLEDLVQGMTYSAHLTTGLGLPLPRAAKTIADSSARCTANDPIRATGEVVRWSVGMPKMYLGTTCAPRRIARNVRADTLDVSTAMSQAELPMPSTSTRLPSNPSKFL